MAKETNFSMRYYFDGLYLAKKQEASWMASSLVESLNLLDLAPGPRVLQIIKELDILEMKIAVFPRKEYVNYADEPPHLYNYFSGHFYFCNHEEEKALLEGLVLSTAIHLLSVLLFEAMVQLPLFTYADFMNGVHNVVFYVLNQRPLGTSLEEYTAMKCWQAKKKQECVHLESTGWMTRLIDRVKDLPGNRELVQAERDQVAFIYVNAPHLSPADCMTQLSRLRAFCPDSMPGGATQWHESFCQFVNGHPMPYGLSPDSLELAFRNIEAGKITHAPVCAWSLMKYKNWLDDVLLGKADLKALPELSYENLFENNLTIGPLKSEETISGFNKQNEQKP